MVDYHYGYVIQGRSTGNVKIGISKDIGQRFTQHRHSCKEPIDLRLKFRFASEFEAREWERRTLDQFRRIQVGGSEWMTQDPELHAVIDSGIVGGEPSIDLAEFSCQLYRTVYPKTQGRPFIFKDRTGRRGWCCVVFHELLQLAWMHWDFDSWESAVEAVDELQHGGSLFSGRPLRSETDIALQVLRDIG